MWRQCGCDTIKKVASENLSTLLRMTVAGFEPATRGL